MSAYVIQTCVDELAKAASWVTAVIKLDYCSAAPPEPLTHDVESVERHLR